MKQSIPPGVLVVVIIAVVAVAGFFYFKNAQPASYPGLNAQQPTKRLDGAAKPGEPIRGAGMPTGPVSREEAFKKGIPGAVPTNR